MLQNDEYMAHTTQSLFLVSLFFGLNSFASCLSRFAKLCGLLGFTNSNHNSNSSNNSSSNNNNNKNYYCNNNCSYKCYSSWNNYSCNNKNKPNKNPQLYNRQQPTTINNLHTACHMEDSSSKMLQTNTRIMQNGRLQLQNAANGVQNGRFRLPNAANGLQNGRFQLPNDANCLQNLRFQLPKAANSLENGHNQKPKKTRWSPRTRMLTRMIRNPGIKVMREEKGSVKCGV